MNKVYKPRGEFYFESSSIPRFPLVTFSENFAKVAKNVRREARPRSKSVFTARSYLSDDLNTSCGDIGKYDTLPSWTAYPVPRPIVVKNYYPDEINVKGFSQY